uniref:CCHC-type domain-containing protein n=1 Tax=Aegilops tauschii subsp. strangulata TaxID=200361 RepID=A0A453KHJ6_AEGTS
RFSSSAEACRFTVHRLHSTHLPAPKKCQSSVQIVASAAFHQIRKLRKARMALARVPPPRSPTVPTPPAAPCAAPLSASAFIDGASGRILPCVALRDAWEASASSLVDPVSGRIFPCVALREVCSEEIRVSDSPSSSSCPLSASQPPVAELHPPAWAAVVTASYRPRLKSIVVVPGREDSPAVGLMPCLAAGPAPVARAPADGPGVAIDSAAPATRSSFAPSASASIAVGDGAGWTEVSSRRAQKTARRQAREAAQCPKDLRLRRHDHPAPTAAAEAFKRRFGNLCYRCLGSRHKFFECRDPITCYSCKRPGHLERGCPERLKSSIATSRAPPPLFAAAAAEPPLLSSPTASPVAPLPPRPAVRRAAAPVVTMEYVPGEAARRPANSNCTVVSTPAMEAEAHRLRSSALILSAGGRCSNISADMVARAVERDFRFPWSDIAVAPFFPDDFLLTMFQPAQRDLALEQRGIEVADVQFKFRPWLPPPGSSRVWRYYCRVAIERLPLNSWDWVSVKEVLGKDCDLDLIERQSTSKANCSALFAWLWTWHPDKIPRASDFNVLQRPDIVRPREFLPEGTPAEEGREGPFFPVLIHLDVVKDYTPISPGASPVHGWRREWPRTYRFKGKWCFGTRDGDDRARSVGSSSARFECRRSDDEEGDGGGCSRRRGKRGGVRKRFLKSMREQAMCRDTASRDPEPRRHRRHADLLDGDAPVGSGAPGELQRCGSLPPASVFATPALEVVRADQMEPQWEQPDMHEVAEVVSDAMSTAADGEHVEQPETVRLEEVLPTDLPPADLAARALFCGQGGRQTCEYDLFNTSATTFGMVQLY